MRRKAPFYVPGMLTLFAFPLLILRWIRQPLYTRTALRLLLPKNDSLPGAGKKIVTIYANPPVSNYPCSYEEAKLLFMERVMMGMQFSYDTSTVLKVVFDEDNTYSQFVHVLNMAFVYDFKRSALVEDSFYLFSNIPPQPIVDALSTSRPSSRGFP